jgi:hypothetical protein
MQAHKRVSQLQHNGRLSRGTHAYPGANALSGSPATWAGQAVAAYHKYRANLLVAEKNHGGDMVRQTLATMDQAVAVEVVWASQGKYARAEPVSALYEQARAHHVGMFATLEDQLCNWVPGEGLPSPNELDACVWALTVLMVDVPQAQELPAVNMRLALDGMQQASPFGQGATPHQRVPQGEGKPRTWPGGAPRPRFGGRTFLGDWDGDDL